MASIGNGFSYKHIHALNIKRVVRKSQISNINYIFYAIKSLVKNLPIHKCMGLQFESTNFNNR